MMLLCPLTKLYASSLFQGCCCASLPGVQHNIFYQKLLHGLEISLRWQNTYRKVVKMCLICLPRWIRHVYTPWHTPVAHAVHRVECFSINNHCKPQFSNIDCSVVVAMVKSLTDTYWLADIAKSFDTKHLTSSPKQNGSRVFLTSLLPSNWIWTTESSFG